MTEPAFTCEDEADFVRRQHGGHGPGCARYAAAVAVLNRISDPDYE